MTRRYRRRTGTRASARSPAGNAAIVVAVRQLLNSKNRPGLGPVLLEGVVLALRGREDVDDHRSEIDENPVRRCRPLATDRPDLLRSHPLDDPIGDRIELALGTT